ncbi:MAG: hypothetical protein H6719_31350 [Sandaracinaceae bacterium]|nr:hypothetical protein [Sandaracinaceae bacterium]
MIALGRGLVLGALLALAAAPARAQDAEPPDDGSWQESSHPHWELLAVGLSVFTTSYVGASLTIFVAEQDRCYPGTPCEDAPLAFLPFAHLLGGGAEGGLYVGMVAIVCEAAGLVLTLMGAAMQERTIRHRRPGEVRVSGLGLDVAF